MTETPPIIMFPGMAMDERLFAAQSKAIPNMRVARWITPYPRESLRNYAARLARQIDPGRPCIVGGASFGGIVALEVATHLNALGCLLIGSIRSPAELSWRYRLASAVSLIGPDGLQSLAHLTASLGRGLIPRSMRKQLQRLAPDSAAFHRWAICAVLRWRPSAATRSVQILQIHGQNDEVLPSSRSHADTLVRHGRHALPLFSPHEVTAFILKAVEQLRVARMSIDSNITLPVHLSDR